MAQQVTIVKCGCGDTGCRSYGISDGIFREGSGWDRERAEFIARAINEHDAHLKIENGLQAMESASKEGEISAAWKLIHDGRFALAWVRGEVLHG